MRTGDPGQATFGDTIRQLRLEKRLSQLQVADRIGIDVTYLSKIENNRVPAPAEVVVRQLADVLGRASEELLILGNRVPAEYARQIRDDSLVADFFRQARGLNPSQRQRIQRIIDENGRG
jgi:transcriptional regulator with XRE-family HTH domain